MPKKTDLDEAERSAVAGLIREHLRTTRNHLSPSLPHLKTAFAKLAPADGPPATPKLTLRPIGLLPRR